MSQVNFTYLTLADVHAGDYASLEEFIDKIYFRDLAQKIYKCFLDDWDKAIGMFDNIALLDIVDGAKVYLFLGSDVPLMPMAGSVKLYDLGASCVLVMVNWLGPAKGVHFSFRANTDKVHCGNIAFGMTDKLVALFGNKGIISGGGHPRAAEFRTRTSGVSLFETMRAFCDVFAGLTKSKI